jgi:flagellar basal-body rod protein FlgB
MPISSSNRLFMNTLISAILTKALDGLSLRSIATAQNIANVNSAGYRPVTVSFEAELQAAASRGEEAVRSLSPEIRDTDPAGAQGVRMDLELETQSETAMRYGALVDVLGRELQLQRAVIQEGGQ